MGYSTGRGVFPTARQNFEESPHRHDAWQSSRGPRSGQWSGTASRKAAQLLFPRDNLTQDQSGAAMDTVIAKNVFATSGGNLTRKVRARITAPLFDTVRYDSCPCREKKRAGGPGRIPPAGGERTRGGGKTVAGGRNGCNLPAAWAGSRSVGLPAVPSGASLARGYPWLGLPFAELSAGPGPGGLRHRERRRASSARSSDFRIFPTGLRGSWEISSRRSGSLYTLMPCCLQ